MRRVYYAFVLSIATHTMFWRGVVLGAAAMLLARWLHVASIVNNFLSVPVGSTPSFVANSFVGAATHGEMLTVATFVLAGVITVSCVYRLAHDLGTTFFHQSMKV